MDARVKHRAEEAASALGQSMTAFTEEALAERADAVLARIRALRMSQRDFAVFLSAIGAAPPPTPALREAMAQYDLAASDEPDSGW